MPRTVNMSVDDVVTTLLAHVLLSRLVFWEGVHPTLPSSEMPSNFRASTAFSLAPSGEGLGWGP